MYKYHAQYNQDQYLNEVIFFNKRFGIFIEIGAHDGISYSNTYFFERALNWKGLCIEPNPEVFEKLKKNRKCVVENCAIGLKNDYLSYLKISGYGEMLSGILDDYDQRHIERIDRTLKLHGGKKELIKVEVRPLSSFEILDDKDIDFMTIDTEGNELKILESIDFTQLHVKVVLVENNYSNPAFCDLLKKFGYVLINKLGSDDIFILQDYYCFSMKRNNFFWKLKKRFKQHVRGIKKRLGLLRVNNG